MIYLVSLIVFSGVVLSLVGMLLFLESKVVVKGDRNIIINDDEAKSIQVPGGLTLLSALVTNGILLPSACGGKGSCGTCKCQVEEGGRDVLPTELSHLSRKERMANVRIACQVKVKADMKIRVPDEIFNIKKYNATVVSNNNVATFIKELVLQLDSGEELDFKAGAYIQIDIPEYELSFDQIEVSEQFRAVWKKFNLWELHAGSQEPVNRAYSLANPPSEKNALRFTIRIATPPPGAGDAPPGVGSSYIFNLKPGDRVILSGPYGEFFIKDTENEMCFVGGGAGMAPLRSQIRHQLLTLQTKRKMTFWYGARSKPEMFFDDEFRGLEKNCENFSYHVALSEPQPEDNWEGLTGFIHQRLYDHYLSSHQDPTTIEYYICGPPMMLNAVIQILDDLGVEAEMIAYDDFG
ncbi:NADH:ubiquinone reductase (Na(+)-transporting) subunit F [Thermodesulfobacteriota bacterium]